VAACRAFDTRQAAIKKFAGAQKAFFAVRKVDPDAEPPGFPDQAQHGNFWAPAATRFRTQPSAACGVPDSA
jgi:hypothetical protein